jgi:cytochrome c-type biogenesis protein
VENVGIFTAFIFGLLSFVSPCVLPIVPGYLSFISGISFDDMKNAENRSAARRRVLVTSLMFILGFSVVFIALGASATAVGQVLREQLGIITKIAGGIIIVFGLHMIGVFKIPFLNYEKRFHSSSKPLGLLGAFLVGLAFAFGWTPCIGPILASILMMAATSGQAGQGLLLLTIYSVGLGLPFLVSGLLFHQFLSFFQHFRRYIRLTEIITGVLLILVGLLLISGKLGWLTMQLYRWLPVQG